MVLILCLTLLPATALAAENAPTTLYVGNYQITNGNATTYLKAGSTQGSLVEGSENDWTVKYDPNTATLTLNGATITGNDNISSVPYGAGIYAQCNSGQPVTLTIELIGENTITGNFGIYVNAEMSANSYGTDASLNITGNGSLIVTGTNSHGLFVKSGTGNASLTINDASVVANTTYTYSGPAGICVQSSVSATSSPNLSLAVDGGSLTASGTGNSDGILLYVGSSQATGATTSLTVADNAIVRAKNGIKAERVDKPTPSGAGIVFDGTEGTVYGDVTLQENITINEGESLTIPDGASLNTGSHEVIVNGGTLTGGDKITGTVKYAPTITTESLPNGTVNEEYRQTLAATGSDTITWSIADGSSLPAGLSLDENTGKIYGTPTTAEESTFTVTATNAYGSSSREFTLTISAPTTIPVTGVSLDQNALTLTEGDTVQLTATVEPANATNKGVTWSSDDETVATVDANGKVTAVSAGTATITATATDGSGKSATCTVTVTGNKPSTGGGTVISKPTTSRISGDDRFETAVEVADQLKKELGVTRFNAIVVAYSDEFADALSASAFFAQENEAPVLVINENNEEYVKKYIEQNLVKGGKVYIMGGNAVVTERFEDSLSEFNVSRLGGADRYETNLLTLKQLNLSGKDTIIIASGLDYADALSASSTGLPVMIVGDKLTDSQIAYLKTLGGDDTYYIAGGTAAVSSEVEKQLKSLNFGTINRLAGDDRYETSVLIAETFYSSTTLALLVNEHNTSLAASYIEDAGVRTVKAIGGTAAITDETLKAII